MYRRVLHSRLLLSCSWSALITRLDSAAHETCRDFSCVCHDPDFLPDAVNCMTTACTTEEKLTGQADLETSCQLAGEHSSLYATYVHFR